MVGIAKRGKDVCEQTWNPNSYEAWSVISRTTGKTDYDA
jgi:hypothetical protein